MQRSGQAERALDTGAHVVNARPISRFAVALPLLGAACALVPSLAMWGFTVDDALVAVRYAHDVAVGAGYRFDPHGASTDGVTPLPWTFLLVPFARTDDALRTLFFAKLLGVVAWAVASTHLGAHLARLRPTAAWMPAPTLALMALAFPIGAWAASGMETGLATALATLAATKTHRPRYAALLAGLAASLRPEMVVWAVALASLAALGNASREEAAADRGAIARAMAMAGAIAAGPFLLCASIRLAVFGRAAPLALLAKPSDLAHGALYAAAATLVLLLPLVAFAPVAIARSGGAARSIAIAFVAHVLAVIVAGGDWMPYARLVVPVVPSLVIVIVLSAARASRGLVVARAAVAFALGIYLVVRAAPAGRLVHADRRTLVEVARPVLASSKVVAALDIGWVSAATNARIVDLAGLTDPSIASLPGGHTSKRVDVAMLLDRDVDTFLAYEDSTGALRVAEVRIVRSTLFEERFERTTTLPLGSVGARYVVYRRR